MPLRVYVFITSGRNTSHFTISDPHKQEGENK